MADNLAELVDDLRLFATIGNLSPAMKSDLLGKASVFEDLARMSSMLIDAAIALVASEEGAFLTVSGDPRAAEFEPWPAMDALMAALDEASPGWRDRMREKGGA